MRTSIWFVRAGQSVANQQRKFQGTLDSPLTPLGIAQSEMAALQLRRQRIVAIYCAPQTASVQTARCLASVCMAPPIEEDAWSDQALGVLTGLTRAAAVRAYPLAMAMRLRDPVYGCAEGGESLAGVAQRCIAAWHGLIQRHQGQRIVVVTQAAPIQIILSAIAGIPLTHTWSWRVDNGSVTGIDTYGTTHIIRCVNATTQLTRKEIGLANRHIPHSAITNPSGT